MTRNKWRTVCLVLEIFRYFITLWLEVTYYIADLLRAAFIFDAFIKSMGGMKKPQKVSGVKGSFYGLHLSLSEIQNLYHTDSTLWFYWLGKLKTTMKTPV